ncbi:MAG: hypothetical protein NC911_10290 [Candidatus Omnitrophica bacterium]|nr:hypothetical protein [Candidatus Omnitrophota bacterium]
MATSVIGWLTLYVLINLALSGLILKRGDREHGLLAVTFLALLLLSVEMIILFLHRYFR